MGISARNDGRSARRPRAKSARREAKASSRKVKQTPRDRHRTPRAALANKTRDVSPRRLERVASSTPRVQLLPGHIHAQAVPRLRKPALPSAATPRGTSYYRSASAPPDERFSYRASSPSYRTPRELVTGSTPRSYREQWTFRTPRGSPVRPRGAQDLTTEDLLTHDLRGVSVSVDHSKSYDPLAEVLADFRSDREAFELACHYGGSRSHRR